jgi:hypothetical protein
LREFDVCNGQIGDIDESEAQSAIAINDRWTKGITKE